MKLRSLCILLALAAAVFLAVACGGGDNTNSSATPTSIGNSAVSSTASDQALKDYYQQLSTILTALDAQMTQLNSQYPSAGNDPDQTRQFLSQFLSATTTAQNDIKNLNPPSTVKDLHDKFVSAVEDVVTAESGLSDDVQNINTAADIKAYFDSHKADFKAKTDVVDSVCAELQTQANSKNLGVDLKCSGASTAATPGGGAATPAGGAATPGGGAATPGGGAAAPGGGAATPGGGAGTPGGGAATPAPGGAPPAATAAAP